MRIRKSASRLLGSAYSASAAPPVGAAPPFDLLPPPPPAAHLAPCTATESCGGTGFSGPSASSAEPCELSRSPWDLIAELSLSDPQVSVSAPHPLLLTLSSHFRSPGGSALHAPQTRWFDESRSSSSSFPCRCVRFVYVARVGRRVQIAVQQAVSAGDTRLASV